MVKQHDTTHLQAHTTERNQPPDIVHPAHTRAIHITQFDTDDTHLWYNYLPLKAGAKEGTHHSHR